MLVVEEFDELNAPVRALLTLKFDSEEAAEYAGSPYLAHVLDPAYDALIAASRRELREDIATDLERHRDASANPAILRAIPSHVRQVKDLESWTPEQRRDYVRVLLSPFRASDEIVTRLIESQEPDS